jgi:hypothetical protein
MEDDIREINGKALHWKINEATIIFQWLMSIREDINKNMPEESEIFELLGSVNTWLNPRREYRESVTLNIEE